jgi:hypothetical protein
MLTLDLLYALLRGLPAKYLDFLDPPWPPFCQRVENALKEGKDPLAALQFALDAMNPWARGMLQKLLSQIGPAMSLPGLTYRQKEALIALRYAGVASLAQLSRVLVQDPSNTYKRLAVLVAKGYAAKFFRKAGVFYFAVSSPLDPSLKHSVHELLTRLINEYSSEAQPTTSTITTMVTIPPEPTTPTIPTTP